MSALFGCFHRDGRPVLPEDLKGMGAALAHHGSDGGGVWAQGQVGLGQRLRCFTEEDRFERQPIVREGEGPALVSDGRLDNRPELMAELGLSGAEAALMPDGECILRAYQRWGQACLQHLVGAFAFAIWDPGTRNCFLARSAIAAPPLFYVATRDRFAFATMPSGLFGLAGVPRVLNEEKLADALVQLRSEPTATWYRGVHRLPTGHALSAGPADLSLRTHWQPDLNREIRFARDEDCLEAFNHLLRRVVGDHLRSATPVGLCLSGGLDSSALAATMAPLLQARGERFMAFTEVPSAGFQGPIPAGWYADETPFVQAIAARHANLDPSLIRGDGRTFLDDLDRLFLHLEMPFRNTANRGWIEQLLQQAAGCGLGVLLDGAQGNLTMSWDGRGLLPTLLGAGHWGRAWREARAQAEHGAHGSAARILAAQGLMPHLPSWLQGLIRSLRGRANPAQAWRGYSAIHPDFAATWKVDERARTGQAGSSGWNPRALRARALAGQDFGPACAAHRSMFGVDMRSPLADVRVAEFCLALPEDQYLRNGEPRSLPRRALAGRLPREVLSNRRRGLQAADWFERLSGARGEIASVVEQLQHCAAARHALDLERMRHLVAAWPRDGWADERTLGEYSAILEQGLMVGRFLQWLEAGG